MRSGAAFVATALVASVVGCRSIAAALGPGRPGAERADAFVGALAARFGPIEREPAFDALRPRLAAAALVPSRVFNDPSLWTLREGERRGVEFEGRHRGAQYRLGVRAAAEAPRDPGDYRGVLGLRGAGRGRYEWSVEEELAIGSMRPIQLAGALTALFRSAEEPDAQRARTRGRETFPRATAAFSRLLALEALDLERDAAGATAVRLGLRLRPERIEASAPRYAAFLRKYATPMRVRLAVEDREGRAWWSIEATELLWTLRLRIRDGSLVPLEGPATLRLPDELRMGLDYSTRMGRFGVGARGLVGDVALTRSAAEKALTIHFLAEPDWQLPFLVEPLLDGPLRHPFEGDGSALGYAVREQADGPTLVVRRYRLPVRENWILRWLGGKTNEAVAEFRRGAEAEADRFNRECLLALRDDLVDLLSVRHAEGGLGSSPEGPADAGGFLGS
jgi:hypothetical protein